MGNWGLVLAAVVWTAQTESGRAFVRSLMKIGIKTALELKEQVVEAAQDAKAYTSDLAPEIDKERDLGELHESALAPEASSFE